MTTPRSSLWLSTLACGALGVLAACGGGDPEPIDDCIVNQADDSAREQPQWRMRCPAPAIDTTVPTGPVMH